MSAPYDQIINVRVPQPDGSLRPSTLRLAAEPAGSVRVADVSHPGRSDGQPGNQSVDQPSDQPPGVRAFASSRVFDAQGLIALPGYFDPHVHGALGADFTDAKAASLATIARYLASHGVTSFLATLISSDAERTAAAIAAIVAAGPRPAGPDGARCWGIHLEGPFLSPQRRGMHDPAALRLPDPQLAAEWLRITPAANPTPGPTPNRTPNPTQPTSPMPIPIAIRQVTLAPELPGAERLITLFRQAGVIVSVGHTDASYDQAMGALTLPSQSASAQSPAATHVTHTFNAMRPFHHREPGTVGAALDSLALCEVIGDGLHVHPAAIRLLLRTKGSHQVCLVSDLSPFAGQPEGRYPLGNLTIVVQPNGCFLPDGTLASSSTPYDQQVARLAAFTHLNPYEMQQVTSANVAREQALDREIGSLAPGHLADFVLVDDQYQLRHVFVGGQQVR